MMFKYRIIYRNIIKIHQKVDKVKIEIVQNRLTKNKKYIINLKLAI